MRGIEGAHGHSRKSMNPVGAAALFLLGGAIAALLPRPLQEDKRVTSGYKKHKHSREEVGRARKTRSGGGDGRGGSAENK